MHLYLMGGLNITQAAVYFMASNRLWRHEDLYYVRYVHLHQCDLFQFQHESHLIKSKMSCSPCFEFGALFLYQVGQVGVGLTTK